MLPIPHCGMVPEYQISPGQENRTVYQMPASPGSLKKPDFQ